MPNFLQALIRHLSVANFSSEILVVDDGSSPLEQTALQAIIQPQQVGAVKVLSPHMLERNSGKGGAILEGWRRSNPARWIGFVDADGAISAEDLVRVVGHIHRKGLARRAYFATRLSDPPPSYHRPIVRALAGRIFAALARYMLNANLTDSQCGFKVVERASFLRVADELTGVGFCFDLELYLALKQARVMVEEVPVDWREKPGGHVHVIKHGLRMLGELCQLRNRMGSRREEVALSPI